MSKYFATQFTVNLKMDRHVVLDDQNQIDFVFTFALFFAASTFKGVFLLRSLVLIISAAKRHVQCWLFQQAWLADELCAKPMCCGSKSWVETWIISSPLFSLPPKTFPTSRRFNCSLSLSLTFHHNGSSTSAASCKHKGLCLYIGKTLPKAQRTRGLSSTYQSNFFESYHKFKHKSWWNIFRISTLHQYQNLNQTSPFQQNLNLKILTKPNQNLDQERTS